MVKMGIPDGLRGEAIEFMFYGQVHQESPATRVDYWRRKLGKLSPSKAQKAGPARATRACLQLYNWTRSALLTAIISQSKDISYPTK